MTKESLIEEFIQHLKLRSANTICAYSSDIRDFLTFIEVRNEEPATIKTMVSIKKDDIREWLTYRVSKQNLSARSNNRAISALRVFCKSIMHATQNNFMDSIRLARTKRTLPKSVPIEQIDFAIKNKTGDWTALRDKALVMLLYGSGLRISEALSLLTEQFTEKTGFITVKGKGNRARTVPLLPNTLESIMQYIAKKPDSSLLFISKKGKPLSRSYFARELKKNSGISPHMLRHSCASHLLNEGLPIRKVQQLLGHKSLSSTQIYTSVSMPNLIREYKKHQDPN